MRFYGVNYVSGDQRSCDAGRTHEKAGVRPAGPSPDLEVAGLAGWCPDLVIGSTGGYDMDVEVLAKHFGQQPRSPEGVP